MGKIFPHIDDRLADFIKRQKMFFVATAPLSPDGHVNLSPKGIEGSFAIIDSKTVAWLDLHGSGVETIAHIRENRRIAIMFCAFDGVPKILRLYGQGEVILPEDSQFKTLARHFPENPHPRSIIRIAVTRIADSCGFGVPIYHYDKQRDVLDQWAAHQKSDGLAAYRKENNAHSIDDLPGLSS